MTFGIFWNFFPQNIFNPYMLNPQRVDCNLSFLLTPRNKKKGVVYSDSGRTHMLASNENYISFNCSFKTSPYHSIYIFKSPHFSLKIRRCFVFFKTKRGFVLFSLLESRQIIVYVSLISSNLDRKVQFSIKCKFIYILLIDHICCCSNIL